MSRVLVTGANGFIGRHVVDALATRDHEIHAVSRSDNANEKKVQWHRADLLDAQQAEQLLEKLKPQLLVHLAWVTTPGEYWQSPDNAAWHRASSRLLRGFANHGGKRAVITGTCAEYDWQQGSCNEITTPTRALSPYSEAKLALHDELQALKRITNLEIAWARVFFPFGPHEHPQRLLPSVIRTLLAGDRAACSDGEQLRDFLYVRDLADALVAVLEHDYVGDINLASGKAIAVRQLVETVAEKLDARDRVDFGARPRGNNEPDKLIADTGILNDVIGWQAGYTMDAAIDETVAWWREQRSTT